MDDKFCEWCSYSGFEVTANQVRGIDHTPVCSYHAEVFDRHQQPRPTESDYRHALYMSLRALGIAEKIETDPARKQLISEAFREVARVLDIGRDESKEQIAT